MEEWVGQQWDRFIRRAAHCLAVLDRRPAVEQITNNVVAERQDLTWIASRRFNLNLRPLECRQTSREKSVRTVVLLRQSQIDPKLRLDVV